MISFKEAEALLREYLQGMPKVIEHCKVVSELAYETALAIMKKHPELKIDAEKVRTASLLHDIGRVHGTAGHARRGGEILRSRGLYELAELVERHGEPMEEMQFLEEEVTETELIEQKIVCYADLRVMGTKIVSFEERLRDVKERYIEHLKAIEGGEKRMQAIVNEINELKA
ncbi:HDIG domain-containing protein [Candidatus Micrarchaeota archaeon]|nr:HDIG domain-containing protein [Candidatus Micrarchaeota archaeon]